MAYSPCGLQGGPHNSTVTLQVAGVTAYQGAVVPGSMVPRWGTQTVAAELVSSQVVVKPQTLGSPRLD